MTPADELLARLRCFREVTPSCPSEPGWSHLNDAARELIAEVEAALAERDALIRTLIAERDALETRIGRLQDSLNAEAVEADVQQNRAEKAEAALATAREEGRREGMEEAAKIATRFTLFADKPDHADAPKLIAAAIRQAAQTEGGGLTPCGDPSCHLDRERKMVFAEGYPKVYCDPCILPLVQALNDAGMETIASCCGHGFRPGRITLRDGRELFIAKGWDEARRVDAAFGTTINGEPSRRAALAEEE